MSIKNILSASKSNALRRKVINFGDETNQTEKDKSLCCFQNYEKTGSKRLILFVDWANNN